ncbi:MAG TPA: hypothetical protein VGF23_19380 [Gaiellaceae bacterium]
MTTADLLVDAGEKLRGSSAFASVRPGDQLYNVALGIDTAAGYLARGDTVGARTQVEYAIRRLETSPGWRRVQASNPNVFEQTNLALCREGLRTVEAQLVSPQPSPFGYAGLWVVDAGSVDVGLYASAGVANGFGSLWIKCHDGALDVNVGKIDGHIAAARAAGMKTVIGWGWVDTDAAGSAAAAIRNLEAHAFDGYAPNIEAVAKSDSGGDPFLMDRFVDALAPSVHVPVAVSTLACASEPNHFGQPDGVMRFSPVLEAGWAVAPQWYVNASADSLGTDGSGRWGYRHWVEVGFDEGTIYPTLGYWHGGQQSRDVPADEYVRYLVNVKAAYPGFRGLSVYQINELFSEQTSAADRAWFQALGQALRANDLAAPI